MYLLNYFLCFLMLSCTYGRPSLSEFRPDYTYSSTTKSYYKLYTGGNTWFIAKGRCESDGAQLFYPEDEAEAREVNNLLSPWSGRNYIWIGISDLREDTVYETVDGRPLSEVHHRWDAPWGEPDRSNNHHCVVMWQAFELWLKECHKPGESFVCKYNPEGRDISTTYIPPIEEQTYIVPLVEQPTAPKFRDDYTYSANRNAFYKFHSEYTTWHDAVAKCRSEGAQLFYAVDEAEAIEVSDLIHPWTGHGQSHIWIGISDLRLDENYETIDGRPLNEVHHRWDTAYGEPDKKGNSDSHCLIMWNMYEMWLKPCSNGDKFVCRYTPGSSQNGETVTEITEGTTEVFKITTPVIAEATESGLDISGLPSEVVTESDLPRSHVSHVEFGNLVGEELQRFPQTKRLGVMVAILEVIRDNGEEAPIECLSGPQQ